MASERERWLGHFDVFLHAKNLPRESLDFAESLRLLANANIAGTPQATVKDERWIIQLADIQIHRSPGVAILLFLGIDKERAAAVYGNIDTLNLRTVAKQENEGGAVSAHLAVKLEADELSGRYSAVLEDVEGLSRSRLMPYIRHLFDKHVQYSVTEADGDERSVEATLTSAIVYDKPISEQLNEARLLAVDMVRKPSQHSIDKSHEYYERLRSIAFRPTSPSSGGLARRIIKSILAREDTKAYPDVRIRLEEDEGRQRTVGINRDKRDALSGAFQLKTHIKDIRPPLPEASSKIVPRFAAHMIEALK